MKQNKTIKTIKPIKTGLSKLYQTHGALTFLLAFYPLLPNVIEIHTKSYLALVKALTGSVSDMDEIIEIMFGKRGLKEYREYVKRNPTQVLPSEIFEALYNRNDTKRAEQLIKAMFFDKVQRNFLNSSEMRAAVILALPEILRQFPQGKHNRFRTSLIKMMASQAIIDQALPSQLAFIEVALRLLTQIERHKKILEEEKLDAIFASIEAKIKAELAGKASAFTAPIRTFSDKKKDPIILSDVNAHNIHEVLLLLAISPAVEVRDEAKKSILELNRIKNINRK
jgi:hypothetical protein